MYLGSHKEITGRERERQRILIGPGVLLLLELTVGTYGFESLLFIGDLKAWEFKVWGREKTSGLNSQLAKSAKISEWRTSAPRGSLALSAAVWLVTCYFQRACEVESSLKCLPYRWHHKKENKAIRAYTTNVKFCFSYHFSDFLSSLHRILFKIENTLNRQESKWPHAADTEVSRMVIHICTWHIVGDQLMQ